MIIVLRTLKQLRPTDRLRPTLPRICEETIADKSGMSRLRSHSECSLESDISDTDGSYKASASDTESDIEMEVSSVHSKTSPSQSHHLPLLTQASTPDSRNVKTNQIALGWTFQTSTDSHKQIELCS